MRAMALALAYRMAMLTKYRTDNSDKKNHSIFTQYVMFGMAGSFAVSVGMLYAVMCTHIGMYTTDSTVAAPFLLDC